MADLLRPAQILLADDDKDDMLLFQEAFEQLLIPGKITNVFDGEQLLLLLDEKKIFPDILFLDLNMPRKNGLECLLAIGKMKKLRPFPVIVFSTSYEIAVIDQLFAGGARHYIRKPADFTALKRVIGQALALTLGPAVSPVSRDKFVLSS